VLGLPVDQSFEKDLETLDLNIELEPTFAWAALMFPFPGTPIERYAKESGFLGPEPVPILDTNKRSSTLNFKGRGEKHRIENLHKLFGLIARFPAMRPFATTLCDLPLSTVYRLLYYAWYGYSVKFRLYPLGTPHREIWAYLGLFARMIRKS